MVIFGRAIWDVERFWENSMRGREGSEFGKQVVFYGGKTCILEDKVLYEWLKNRYQ